MSRQFSVCVDGGGAAEVACAEAPKARRAGEYDGDDEYGSDGGYAAGGASYGHAPTIGAYRHLKNQNCSYFCELLQWSRPMLLLPRRIKTRLTKKRLKVSCAVLKNVSSN